ncbi:MAG: hypothetical protein AAF578_00225 [Pseudomonadota bacterium]
MSDWITVDPGRPQDFLCAIADALERSRELECQWQDMNHAWHSDDYVGSVSSVLRGGAQAIRYRMKPRKLAEHWKPLSQAEELSTNILLFAENSHFDIMVCHSNEDSPDDFIGRGWTHYAEREALLYGTD